MTEVFEAVLLLALPASGKSEVRRYLKLLPPEKCKKDFHMGPTVQLDDYPYVHLMRRIDDELASMKQKRVFFHAADRPFQDPTHWGTLIHLLNEDYADLLEKKIHKPSSAAEHLLERYESAARKAGVKNRLFPEGGSVRSGLVKALEKEARGLLDDLHSNYPDTLNGKTLLIEFARGGPHGSTMPLKPPLGYQHSVSLLSKNILKKAVIVYVWVTPEESRRKNDARTDPNDPGSILHHGVPIEVMMNDYGCDDIGWLEENSGKPGTVLIRAGNENFHIPLGRFDNRKDKTSFLRAEPSDWNPKDVEAVHAGLKTAFNTIKEFNR